MRRQLSETSAWTMVTSPQALGMIRADYSDVGRKALQGEVGKDLVKLPVRATVGRRR
jgi:protein required for attachment to host cells